MKLIISFAVCGFLTACASPSNVKSTNCGPMGECVQDGNITVFGNVADATSNLEAAKQGAAAFETYFGVKPSPITVVMGGSMSAERLSLFQDHGHDLILPWLSSEDKQTLFLDDVKAQVLEQTKSLPRAQQEAILAQAIEQAKSQSGEPNKDTIEDGALTHELGHLWFMDAFKLDTDHDMSKGYGGWAPDWLDETSAVLLENDSLAKKRRASFAETPAEDFYPLADFFTMEHPSFQAVKQLSEELDESSEGGLRFVTLSGEEADEFIKNSAGGDPVKFYIQSRGFADYLIEKTGDKRIFAKVTTALQSGITMEGWLASRDDLPNSIADLQIDWESWLESR